MIRFLINDTLINVTNIIIYFTLIKYELIIAGKSRRLNISSLTKFLNNTAHFSYFFFIKKSRHGKLTIFIFLKKYA